MAQRGKIHCLLQRARFGGESVCNLSVLWDETTVIRVATVVSPGNLSPRQLVTESCHLRVREMVLNALAYMMIYTIKPHYLFRR